MYRTSNRQIYVDRRGFCGMRKTLSQIIFYKSIANYALQILFWDTFIYAPFLIALQPCLVWLTNPAKISEVLIFKLFRRPDTLHDSRLYGPTNYSL